MNKQAVKTLIVIPVRYDSTRLPGKALLKETGKYMIEHVYEKALQVKLAHKVVIATDDVRIYDAASSFGATSIMTSKAHQSGSDRVAEVSAKLPEYDMIVNIQGDEPELEPTAVDKLITIATNSDGFMYTLCAPFDKYNYHQCVLPSCTKVALGKQHIVADTYAHEALYFSRSLIPYYRANNQSLTANNSYYLHLGVYAFSKQSLATYINLSRGNLEQIECLEQLRALEHGYKVMCAIIDKAHTGIDTAAEYSDFVTRYKRHYK